MYEKLRWRLLLHLLGGKWHRFFLVNNGYDFPPELGIEFCRQELTLPLSIQDAADLEDVLGDLIMAASEPS